MPHALCAKFKPMVAHLVVLITAREFELLPLTILPALLWFLVLEGFSIFSCFIANQTIELLFYEPSGLSFLEEV